MSITVENGGYPLLSEEERYRLLVEWNDTQVDYPWDSCIHELFEAQEERTPEAIAVIFKDERLTYRELNQQANQVAHQLQRLGVGPEVCVGICVERSSAMVVGLLGILKAGGAYVPLDPTYPKERLAFMLEDSQVRVLVTQESLLEQLPPHSASILCLDADQTIILREGTEQVDGAVTTNHLAYMIYTSGSTGKPKGVAIEHHSAVALLSWARKRFGSEQLAGVLASTSICFDLSVFELFVPLSWGGKVIIAENVLHLPTLLAVEEITLINTVPSVMTELLRIQGVPDSVHTVNLAGEPLSRRLVDQLYQQTGVQQVFNLYGPSEDTTYSTCALLERGTARTSTPPIGRPIANTQIYLLNVHFQPVPIGVPGELYISGAGLARGYHNRPELTAEKFIAHPFSIEPGIRLYKTGDLARYSSDGNIEFLGRIDHQVKLRGFRIELGEIEAVLAEHPAVQDVVVLVREDVPGDRRLVAYFVPAQKLTSAAQHMLYAESTADKAISESDSAEVKSNLLIGNLHHFLKERLPEYMVPSSLIPLERLPLTPNGKLDRYALPPPVHISSIRGEDYVAPRSSVEETLVKIWMEVLRLELVSVHDNFFELGGHSLQITQIISRIRDTFQIKLPFQSLFTSPTVANLAQVIETAVLKAQSQPMSSIQPVLRDGDLPLSFPQERVWFIQQLNPANKAYTFQATLRFMGVLDISALEQSLSKIVQRHEILRTTFPDISGEPVQIIHQAQPVNLPVVDLQSVPEHVREIEAQRLIAEEIRKPFDLTQLPLFRWILLRLRAQEHVLIHVEHHMIHDGWSFNIFLRELLELYQAFFAGKPSTLPELPFQFVDFAHWQRQWMQEEDAKTQLAYWKKKLAGSPPVLNLPSDRPRPPVQSFQGAAPRAELPPSLCESLRDLSRHEGVTLFMLMFAAFLTLLYRYTGLDDLCVASAVANRRLRESENLIGMIVNTIVLRTDLHGNSTFQELLERVHTVTVEAYAHEDLPFGKVVEALQPKRSLSYLPLYQVMFSFHDSPIPNLELPGLTIDLLEAVNNGSAKCDLDIMAIPRTEQQIGRSSASDTSGITVIWEYSTDLFDDATIRRMMGHYRSLLEAIVADPTRHILDLPLLTEVEQRQLLVEWNDTGADCPKEQCIHQLFEAQVERTPEAIALVFGGEEFSYRELNRRANQLAHHLQTLGVRPEVLVGICAERSLEMIVGLLGVLKAGGAYVPLDPVYPQERLAFIMQDSQPAVLLTQERLRARMPGHGAQIVYLDADWEEIAQESQANPVSGVTADNLAYVIYTSGSTGRPNGVLITHRSLVNHSFTFIEHFHVQAKDRILQFASLSFDVAAEEIFPSLLAGASVVVRTDEVTDFFSFSHFLEQERLTILNLPTSYWHLWVSHLSQRTTPVPASLRLVVVGGEKALPERFVTWRKWAGNSIRWANMYGPTEATITSTIYEPATSSEDLEVPTLPIGRPIANTQVYVLDPFLQPVPVGVPGELHISGAGLARGYLNRPELTTERFIRHPFSSDPHARLYKTGDLARYLPDGNIEFLGRIDHQVKIRGFRVELGEIEAVLGQHAAVREAVVVDRESTPDDKQLVAYVVPLDMQVPTSSDLRNYLKERLPNYMVPSSFVILDALPLTPNGKLDRMALPVPDWIRPELQTPFVAPRSSIEKELARIWAELLGLEGVGIYDNFFDVGGHSLLATQIISRLRNTFQVEVSLRTFFGEATIAGLASAVIQSQNEQTARRTIIAHSEKQGKVEQLLARLDQLSDEERDALLSELLAEGEATE